MSHADVIQDMTEQLPDIRSSVLTRYRAALHAAIAATAICIKTVNLYSH